MFLRIQRVNTSNGRMWWRTRRYFAAVGIDRCVRIVSKTR